MGSGLCSGRRADSRAPCVGVKVPEPGRVPDHAVSLGARNTLRLEVRVSTGTGNRISQSMSSRPGWGATANSTRARTSWDAKRWWRSRRVVGRSASWLNGDEDRKRGIGRDGYRCYRFRASGSAKSPGFVAPFLKNIGAGGYADRLPPSWGEVGVEIRGRSVKAKVVPTPFYKRPAATSAVELHDTGQLGQLRRCKADGLETAAKFGALGGAMPDMTSSRSRSCRQWQGASQRGFLLQYELHDAPTICLSRHALRRSSG